MTLTGSDGKRILGSTTVADDPGRLEIYGWAHGILSSYDATSGLPTGERRHQPLVVAKPIERASPRLMAALLDHEVLSEWRLEVWRRRAPAELHRLPPVADLLDLPRDEAAAKYVERLERSRRREERCYTIELTSARVTGIETAMLDSGDLENSYQEPGERVSFTYEEIAWIWGSGEGATRIKSRWSSEVFAVGKLPLRRPTEVRLESLVLGWEDGKPEVRVKAVGGVQGVEVKGRFRNANRSEIPARGKIGEDGEATIGGGDLVIVGRPRERYFEFQLEGAEYDGAELPVLPEELLGWHRRRR